MKRKAAQNSGKTAKRKPRGRPFRRGQSGNPGGRPKLPEDVKSELDVMRGPLTMKAIRTLERNMDDDDGMVSNMAAREWLKKTLPDEALRLEVSGPDGKPMETDLKVEHDDSPERLARVLDVLRRSGALPPGVEEAPAGDAPAAEDERVDSAGPD